MNMKVIKMGQSILCLLIIGFAAVDVYADTAYDELANIIRSLDAVEESSEKEHVNEDFDDESAREYGACVVKNVAVNKPAKMSSIYAGTLDATAGLAVDGVTEQRFWGNSPGPGRAFCTHTEKTPNNWWYVDLQRVYEIKRLTIYNRKDCCSDRARGLSILVGRRLQKMTQVAFVDRIEAADGIKTINLNKVAFGRYVKIVQTVNEYLTLCEVQVFGKPASCSGPCENGGTLQEGSYDKCDCVEKEDYMFRGNKCEETWVRLPSQKTYKIVPRY